ncbi:MULTISPECIES: hypothetical protein [Roseobacteraceae]|uniref:Uncharacterized protein n=2 Tax=Roseobacteraceae TaxID=2854170 RepID=A0A1I6V2A4_9RHOB|nr:MULTISPECIES: hypothetical protein [Roseobacteraceae]MBE9640891.1 hypothetical protein [Salipiger mangrovisoli]SDI88878.1 hypothetical protein SAMN04488245_12944 [Alloyangia pacifica]SFT07795.1 hypothetical protein SAMN04488050_109242 [Alloyangia pacifica]
MTNLPIDLDRHRTPNGRLESRIRRMAANSGLLAHLDHNGVEIDVMLLADSLRRWIEAMEQVRVLLRQHQNAPEVREAMIKTIIEEALKDLDLLKEREGTTL